MNHSTIRNIHFSYEKIIIGSSLEALLYCYYNNVPFVYTKMEYPDRFSYFDCELDLSNFGINNKIRILTGPDATKKIGVEKSWLWEHLYLCLSLAGLNPLIDKVSSIRIEDNKIKAFTHKARSAEINVDKIIVFNSAGVHGLPSPINIPEKKYKVYDWINVRSGLKHKFDWIEDTSHFVKCIYFYPTDRIAGDQVFKDACAISYLSEKELEDFEYSDINSRFKVLYMMKQAGIKGPRNGYDPNHKTKVKYRGVRIETSHREVKLLNPLIYESTGNIEFNYDSFDDIINNNQLEESYVREIYRRTSCQY